MFTRLNSTLYSLSRKPVVYVILALLIVGAFLSTFLFVPPAKEANAVGNTYYVDTDVAVSGNGLSWATAKKTINEGVALAFAGDTVEISGGTYAEYVQITVRDGTAGNYITFRGSSDLSHDDTVIIDAATTASNGISITKDYVKIENLTIRNATVGKYAVSLGVGADYTIINKILAENDQNGFGLSGTNMLVEDSVCAGCNNSSFVMGNTGTLVNSIVRSSNTAQSMQPKLTGTGSWTIDHSVIAPSGSGVTVDNQGTGVLTIKNSILIGSLISAATVNSTSGGTATVSRSLVLPSSANPAFLFSAGVTDGGGNIYQDPHLTSYGRSGFAQFVIDDYDLTYAEQVAAILNPLGMHVTFYIYELGIVTQPNWQSRLQTFIAAGNEVGAHSYSHSQLNLTTAFSITGSRTSPTVQVDRTNDRIRLHDTEGGNQDVTGFKEKTLGTIRTEINAMTGFTAGALTAGMSTSALGESLAELAPASCSSAKTLLLDLTTNGTQGFFKVEIFDPKTWLQTQLAPYTINSFAYPYNVQSAASGMAVQTAGYTSARATGSKTLANLTIYNMTSYERTYIKTGGDSQLVRNTATVCVNAAQTGQWIQILTHHDDAVGELSLAQVATIANTIVATQGIDFTKTVGEVANYVRTSGLWSTADSGVTWTRSYTDGSNYRPLLNSPVIDAGLDTNNNDYDGNQRYDDPDVPNTGSAGAYTKDYVDIGAYEYVIPPDPTLTSATHPSQVAWYTNNTPQITVSPTSPTTTYKYSVDQTLAPILASVLAGTASATATFTVPGGTITSDGVWYIHVAALNLDGDSSTNYATYTINYDNSAPADFTPIANPSSSLTPSPADIIQTIRYYLNTPLASFTISSTHAFDLPFIFDASESFSTRGIVKYAWDFGDGIKAEGMKVEHQYQTPGRYTVTLTITDNAGRTAAQQQTVDADPTKPTVKNISADGNDIIFKGKSYPKTIVHLEIHSNPLSVQANADEKGEWVYKVADAKEALGTGDHTVLAKASYVLTDKTELTSEPSKTYDFKVSLDDGRLKVEMGKTRTWQYIALGLVLIIVIGFVLNRVRKRK